MSDEKNELFYNDRSLAIYHELHTEEKGALMTDIEQKHRDRWSKQDMLGFADYSQQWWSIRLEMIRFQIKSFDLISISDFKSNRIDCQEIKLLKFRFDLISFDLKSIEIDTFFFETKAKSYLIKFFQLAFALSFVSLNDRISFICEKKYDYIAKKIVTCLLITWSTITTSSSSTTATWDYTKNVFVCRRDQSLSYTIYFFKCISWNNDNIYNMNIK
jgi:hypothetical protein